MKLDKFVHVVLLSFLLLGGLFTPAQTQSLAAPAPAQADPDPNRQAQIACTLLDDPQARGLMSAMLEIKLLILCDRQGELGGPAPAGSTPQIPGGLAQVADVLVNNPAGDVGDSTTQSETSIAVNPNTGTVCVAYNDSQHWAQGSIGFAGFSRSTNGGLSFTDRGAIPAGGGGNGFGDPALAWRRADGRFYYASLHTNGLGLWYSTDDCNSFGYRSMIHTSVGDDREMIAIDNNISSPYYGRIYVAWTDFSAGGRIYVTYSDNDITWSTPVAVSAAGEDVQAGWPTVGPNSYLYVAWVRWNPYPNGPIDIEIARSTDGGTTFSARANPMTGKTNPRDNTATSNCGRPALKANTGDGIRITPAPQIVVGPDECLHVVYTYDPDGYNTGDVINVYYRRSCNEAFSWGAEIQLNDDGTLTDQWFPTISVGQDNRLVTTWYDRRNDPGINYAFDYYKATSYNGGVTWQPNVRVSDVSSAVPQLAPNFDPIVAACYHGDYDQQVQSGGDVYIAWSDDRNFQNAHPDPDIWFERDAVFTPPQFHPSPIHVTVPWDDVLSTAAALTNTSSGPYPFDLLEIPGGFNPAMGLLDARPSSAAYPNPEVEPRDRYIVNGVASDAPAAPAPEQDVPAGLAPLAPNAILIDFDQRPQPCHFIDTTALRVDYESKGALFLGPAIRDGGAILDECGSFGVTGYSPPNFLAFHAGGSLADGGNPQDPETILFVFPVSHVQINAGSPLGGGQSIVMEAFDAEGHSLGTDDIVLDAALQSLSISANGITRVVISSTVGIYVLDDLIFEPEDIPWFGGDPSAGTLPPHGSLDLDVHFTATLDAGVDQPGDYGATLLVSGDPPAFVPVTMTVLPPTTMGQVVGTVSDVCNGDPVQVHVDIPGGDPITATMGNPSGDYTAWLYPDTYDLVFDAPEYLPYTATAEVTAGKAITLNVTLTPMRACLATAPDVFEVTLLTGTTAYTHPTGLNITNSGGAELEFQIQELPGGSQPVARAAAELDLPMYEGPCSTGAVPHQGTAAGVAPSQALLTLGTLAYATEDVNKYLTLFDLDAPEVLPALEPFAPGYFPGAGEYVGGYIYVIDNSETLYKLDPTTGALLISTTVTPALAAGTYTGMAFDPTSGVVYACSTNVSNSYLFELDLTTAVMTQIGEITNSPAAIGIAIDGSGQLWGYDIADPVDDNFLTIDKATAAGTVIGPIGFNANFGQGLGYDPATDQVYMAAFNNGEFRAELRTVDTGTGNSTLVGVLGSTTPGGLTQLPFLAIPIHMDVPWFWESPADGTVPAKSAGNVDIVFSAAVTDPMPLGTYTSTMVVYSNDWLAAPQYLDVIMHITDQATAPSASFDSNTPVCLGSPLVLTNTTMPGDPSETWYLWEFGDGVTSTLGHPTHTYAAAGPYTVNLTADNDYLSDTATAPVEVLPLPAAGFGYVADEFVVTFSNLSIEATDYLWAFGDGITSTLENPVHAYTLSGTYTVTLSASGMCGVDTVQDTVTVPPVYSIYLPLIFKNHD